MTDTATSEASNPAVHGDSHAEAARRAVGSGLDLGGRLRTSHERRPRLSFDLDVDVCVIGAGLAGLTVAREVARLGSSVVVLEGRQVGWNAAGHNFGAVMPGFGIDATDLIDRIGFEDARELWGLSQEGVEYVRAAATEHAMAGISLSEGALEVSILDSGDQLIRRLQTIGEDFGADVEGWQVDRVREVLRTPRYFHAVHYPKAFQIDGRRYVHGLAVLAEQAGARIFEDSPVIALDPAGIRKRIGTPSGRVRASQIVLAGGVHLGGSLRRLSDTLLPVWRYVAVTAPLGVRLAEQISFSGAVRDTDGVSHYRIVDGDRLMWCGGDSSWAVSPARFARWVQRQIRTLYPALGTVEIAETFGGVTGLTVHGMPQIGAMRRGVWVASGFGRQGFNTSAVAGQMIARGIVEGDDRWRLFSPFELVWAGGAAGKVVGQAIISLTRGHATVAGTLARYRERAVLRARERLARAAAARRRRPPAPPSGSHGSGSGTPRRQITDIGPAPVPRAQQPSGPPEAAPGS